MPPQIGATWKYFPLLSPLLLYTSTLLLFLNPARLDLMCHPHILSAFVGSRDSSQQSCVASVDPSGCPGRRAPIMAALG